MNNKWILPLTLMVTSFTTLAEKWEAHVTKNLTATKASQVAQTYRPAIHCNSSDRPDTQTCYSNAIKLLVVDGELRTMFAFEIGHTNQNQPEYLMTPYVNSFNVPANVADMMLDTLDTYEILNETADEITQQLATQDMSNIMNSSKHTTSSSNDSDCDDSAEGKVVKAVYDGRTTGNIQSEAQTAFVRKYGSLDNAFNSTRLSSFGFNVSGQGVSLGGTFTFNAITRNIEKTFWHGANNSNPPQFENTVVYDLKLSNGYLSLSVNEAGTKLNGVPLNRINAGGSTHVSPCLLEELNKYLPAAVDAYSSSGTLPDGTTSLPVGWGRIPVTSGNGRTGGGQIQSEFCVWRFYIGGREISQMIGPCP